MPTSTTSVHVATKGVFLMLADEACTVNGTEFWARTLPVSDRALLISNLVKRGELFVWNLILDGTFRIDVSILDTRPGGQSDDDAEAISLILSTGGLVIRSSTTTTPLLTVSPGSYCGTLSWDFEQESRHSVVKSIDQYPMDEGPDGIIKLWPAKTLSAGR